MHRESGQLVNYAMVNHRHLRFDESILRHFSYILTQISEKKVDFVVAGSTLA